MSTSEPSEELCRLAWFVVNVYSLLWFRAKKQWRATEAPAITYKAMKLITDLKAEHLDENQILEPVFKRGLMHWAHSEQLLLACLADLDADVRGRAVARIIQLHHESKEPPRKR